MRSTIVALASATMAAAQYSNNTAPVQQKTVTPPAQVGAFHYLGCFDSSTGSPSFHVQSSNPRMNADLCAASCPTNLMALDGDICLCGDEIDEIVTKRLDDAQCNTPCGGNSDQACGGSPDAGEGNARRLYIGGNLSVFIRGYGDDGHHDDGHHDDGCPDDKCVVKPVCPDDTCDKSWFEREIVCYGDYCAPQLPCEECDKFRVICRGDICYPEKCDREEDSYRLIICDGEGDDSCRYNQCEGDECFRKVVCYDGVCLPQACYGDECQKKFVCEDDYCFHDECTADECYSKIVCKGAECQVEEPCYDNACGIPLEPLYPECLERECHGDQTPVVPVVPVTPVHPGEPVTPAKPVVPVVPVHPGEPNKPFTPEHKPVQAAGSAWTAPAMAMSVLGAGLALLF